MALNHNVIRENQATFFNPYGRIRDREERAEYVRQFLEGEMSAEQIVQQYHLSSTQVIYQWIGHYIEEILMSSGVNRGLRFS